MYVARMESIGLKMSPFVVRSGGTAFTVEESICEAHSSEWGTAFTVVEQVCDFAWEKKLQTFSVSLSETLWFLNEQDGRKSYTMGVVFSWWRWKTPGFC